MYRIVTADYAPRYQKLWLLSTRLCLQVAAEVGSNKSPEECEDLYRKFQTFLGIPSTPGLDGAFVAMVVDHYNNLKAETDAAQPAGSAGAEVPTKSGSPFAQNANKTEEVGPIQAEVEQDLLPLNQVRLSTHQAVKPRNPGLSLLFVQTKQSRANVLVAAMFCELGLKLGALCCWCMQRSKRTPKPKVFSDDEYLVHGSPSRRAGTLGLRGKVCEEAAALAPIILFWQLSLHADKSCHVA